MRAQPKRYTDLITGLELVQAGSSYLAGMMLRDRVGKLMHRTGATIVRVHERIDLDGTELQAVYDSKTWTG